MKELETELKKLATKPAPESLDRRVAATIRVHGDRQVGLLAARVPLWACATACLACAVAGFLLQLRPSSPTPLGSTAYFVEAGPDFRAVFAAEPDPTDFFLRTKEQVN